jgi:hypothetical protein
MEGCYRALLYLPSLPNTPFAELSLQIANKFGNLKKKKILVFVL